MGRDQTPPGAENTPLLFFLDVGHSTRIAEHDLCALRHSVGLFTVADGMFEILEIIEATRHVVLNIELTNNS
jgi:hypothetical protein